MSPNPASSRPNPPNRRVTSNTAGSRPNPAQEGSRPRPHPFGPRRGVVPRDSDLRSDSGASARRPRPLHCHRLTCRRVSAPIRSSIQTPKPGDPVDEVAQRAVLSEADSARSWRRTVEAVQRPALSAHDVPAGVPPGVPLGRAMLAVLSRGAVLETRVGHLARQHLDPPLRVDGES